MDLYRRPFYSGLKLASYFMSSPLILLSADKYSVVLVIKGYCFIMLLAPLGIDVLFKFYIFWIQLKCKFDI